MVAASKRRGATLKAPTGADTQGRPHAAAQSTIWDPVLLPTPPTQHPSHQNTSQEQQLETNLRSRLGAATCPDLRVHRTSYCGTRRCSVGQAGQQQEETGTESNNGDSGDDECPEEPLSVSVFDVCRLLLRMGDIDDTLGAIELRVSSLASHLRGEFENTQNPCDLDVRIEAAVARAFENALPAIVAATATALSKIVLAQPTAIAVAPCAPTATERHVPMRSQLSKPNAAAKKSIGVAKKRNATSAISSATICGSSRSSSKKKNIGNGKVEEDAQETTNPVSFMPISRGDSVVQEHKSKRAATIGQFFAPFRWPTPERLHSDENFFRRPSSNKSLQQDYCD